MGYYEVKLYKPQIKKITDAHVKAVGMTAEKLRSDLISSQVMPFLEGTLQNIQTDVDVSAAKQGKIQIVHDTPYAKRLYYNPQYNFTKTFNPNAKGMWWEEWLNGSKKKHAMKIFSFFFKKLSGV